MVNLICAEKPEGVHEGYGMEKQDSSLSPCRLFRAEDLGVEPNGYVVFYLLWASPEEGSSLQVA